jgi:hypothetical protein
MSANGLTLADRMRPVSIREAGFGATVSPAHMAIRKKENKMSNLHIKNRRPDLMYLYFLFVSVYLLLS